MLLQLYDPCTRSDMFKLSFVPFYIPIYLIYHLYVVKKDGLNRREVNEMGVVSSPSVCGRLPGVGQNWCDVCLHTVCRHSLL